MARPRKEEMTEVVQDQILDASDNSVTIEEIKGMGIIQLHNLIKTKYPQLNELLDVYNRTVLQDKLIEALGL